MATVLRLGQFRFWIWSNDHNPPHVHMENGSGEVRILLGNESKAPEIDENSMCLRDARKVWRIVAERQEYFLIEWRKIHGKVEI
jgi:hypothetical protein